MKITKVGVLEPLFEKCSGDKVRIALITRQIDCYHSPFVTEAIFNIDEVVEGLKDFTHVFLISEDLAKKAICSNEIIKQHNLHKDVSSADMNDYSSVSMYWQSEIGSAKFLTANPDIQFGRVCISNTGIPIDVIVERFNSGESVDSLGADFGLCSTLIRYALIEYGRIVKPMQCYGDVKGLSNKYEHLLKDTN